MSEVIIGIVGVLSTFFGIYFTFVFQKSKYLQEVEKMKIEVIQAKKSAETTEIDNDSKIIDLYKSALDDLPHRFEERFTGLTQLFEQKEKILREELSFLSKERDLWKKKYNDLLKEHRQYKKEHP